MSKEFLTTDIVDILLDRLTLLINKQKRRDELTHLFHARENLDNLDKIDQETEIDMKLAVLLDMIEKQIKARVKPN